MTNGQFFSEGFFEGKFKTRNLSIASTLSALGHQIEVLPIEGRPHLCGFIFNDTRAIRKDITSYWERGLAIEPQLLLEQYEILKAKIRHVLNNQN